MHLSLVHYTLTIIEKFKIFIHKIFIQHPNDVGESYMKHFVRATSYSLRILSIGVICFVHALIPYLFTYTTSNLIAKLHKQLSARINKTNSDQ